MRSIGGTVNLRLRALRRWNSKPVVHPREDGEVVERRGMLVQARCRARSAAVIVSVSTVAMMAMVLMLAAAAVPAVVPLASAV